MSDCGTCAETTGTKRYCAPLRCYCAHEDCYAFASYRKSQMPTLTNVKAADSRMAKSWAERGEGSWIDGL